MEYNQEIYQRAKKRVEAKLVFYQHLAIYIVVGAVLIGINYATSSEYLWFWWPILGWGIGVLLHALSVFVFSGVLGVTEGMIEKEMEQETFKK